ncbi:MAG: type II secretion system protein [Nitrospirales bacterium]
MRTHHIRNPREKRCGHRGTFPHSNRGFTLVEMIGVLAIMAIVAGVVAPNIFQKIKTANQDAETHQLSVIGQGVELYVRQNLAFPSSLIALSPDYVSIAQSQLNTNASGFLRYLVLQPNITGFSNSTGLATNQLGNARFLLITHLGQHANPAILTDANFESWWNTDETATPDLKIYRGHLGHLFHLLSVSGSGAGGSYMVNGSPTNSGGALLSTHLRYHLAGTSIGLDENNTYGTPELQVALTTDAGYQFDPDCPAGSKWRTISSGCYVP